jgi:hypothetical protein
MRIILGPHRKEILPHGSTIASEWELLDRWAILPSARTEVAHGGIWFELRSQGLDAGEGGVKSGVEGV